MKSIGGYFGLELQKGKQTFHAAPAFKSGRSALHYILATIQPENVYIPFYTCDGLLESFIAANVAYQFYPINASLEPEFLPDLKAGEYFLYINYFGIKTKTVDLLIEKYRDKLIIDSSQAFFNVGNEQTWSFNSCRKFFGVPDGSFLYSPSNTSVNLPEVANEDYTIQHLINRFNGNVSEGYFYFSENEKLCNADLKRMSLLSEYLLSNIDYADCIEKRKKNFSIFHQELKDRNRLLIDCKENDVPMVYPLLLSGKLNHEHFWQQNLYVPIFWNDVLKRETKGFETEKYISSHLLPLPIDHRYTVEDINQIINFVNQYD